MQPGLPLSKILTRSGYNAPLPLHARGGPRSKRLRRSIVMDSHCPDASMRLILARRESLLLLTRLQRVRFSSPIKAGAFRQLLRRSPQSVDLPRDPDAGWIAARRWDAPYAYL